MNIYNKDEKFNTSKHDSLVKIRRWEQPNAVGGGIIIEFKIITIDYLSKKQAGLNFEELSNRVIKRVVFNIHNKNKWKCLLYEWNGIEFEQVNSKEQDWFVCSDNFND